MIIDILTIFPQMVAGPLGESLIGKAIDRKLIKVRVIDIRKYAVDSHRTTDDRPFGGGSGMVMKPEPLAAAIGSVRADNASARILLLSPQGRLFKQEIAFELSRLSHICLVCGRYEGVDERIRKHYVDDEISLGDYVVTGGELPALVIVDAVVRLIPGVLGNDDSIAEESFIGGLLEYPHYTRPEVFENHRVPEILLSGNHGAIRRWRRQQSLYRTWQRRPDLLEKNKLSQEDEELLAEAIRRGGELEN
jgi:tRNA (guanine37-N1)-methyltransferase